MTVWKREDGSAVTFEVIEGNDFTIVLAVVTHGEKQMQHRQTVRNRFELNAYWFETKAILYKYGFRRTE